MQTQSDKELNTFEEPEPDLAHLEQQAESDEHQTEYEKGTIEL
jgi:hypothetical protein